MSELACVEMRYPPTDAAHTIIIGEGKCSCILSAASILGIPHDVDLIGRK